MKNTLKKTVLVLGSLSLLTLTHARGQSVITEWNFDNLSTGTNLTPSASSGANKTSSNATSVGMTSPGTTPGNYPTANATGPDTSNIAVAVGTDTDNTSTTNNVWRIVGSTATTTPTNGWNSGAAIGTQGAQFSVSTAGFANISFSFDLQLTSQGEANLQAEYSTDGGTTWLNAPLTYAGGEDGSILTNSSVSTLVQGTYFHADTTSGSNEFFNDLSVNLSGVTAANNDANFELRLVNAATGASDVAFENNTALNNKSGNWRFDDVQVDGTTVPEPSPKALFLGGGLLLAFLFRRRALFDL